MKINLVKVIGNFQVTLLYIYHSDAQNLVIMSHGKIEVIDGILQLEYGDNFRAETLLISVAVYRKCILSSLL